MPLRLWPGRIYSPAGTISVTLLKDLFLSSMYNYFCLTAHLVFMPGTYGDMKEALDTLELEIQVVVRHLT